MVEQAKNHRGESISGDFSTLTSPCPKCGGIVQETYKKFQCGKCDFALWKILAGRQFEVTEMEELITKREVGTLQGFRSKMGRLFNANIKLTDEYEMKFDFGETNDENTEEVDFSGQDSLGKCLKCDGRVFEHGISYICEKSVGANRTCNFKTGKIILNRPMEREQVTKLLLTGKTDLLTKFISKKGRPFSAYLAADDSGKTRFEFEEKRAKVGSKIKTSNPKTKKSAAKKSAAKKSAAKKPAAKKPAAKKPVTKKSAA